jgi:hypothetical protein
MPEEFGPRSGHAAQLATVEVDLAVVNAVRKVEEVQRAHGASLSLDVGPDLPCRSDVCRFLPQDEAGGGDVVAHGLDLGEEGGGDDGLGGLNRVREEENDHIDHYRLEGT